jgi:DNA helicase-2/ATP-dependent DNA helicase PcrA
VKLATIGTTNETDAFLKGLNERQREAVTAVEGPVLILAGPGSGKTRVITHRIAYLVARRGVRPWRIMAVTFTNKAAREMRERVEALLGDAARDLMLGTFHSVCARILRVDGGAIGLDRSFTIYDDGDQLNVVKRIFGELSVDQKQTSPRAVLGAISRAKNELLSPHEYARAVGSYFEEIVARVYRKYQTALEEENAVDFDDLLSRTLELFHNEPKVLEKYQQRFQHVLVDEFQDTNVVQYALTRRLAQGHGNICVVGDPDQSIYRWRAADIRNILNFEQDFPNTKTVLLEQNYRSTQTILDVAQGVIAAAESRKEKGLWTENQAGPPVAIYEARDDEDEANYVVREIAAGLRAGRHPRDYAVMYRTNAQSRALEDALVRSGIRYRLIGGTRFYERREVKDVLAYLRLINNPRDSISLARAINTPPRGIGAGTLNELALWARELGVPPYYALQVLADQEQGLPAGDDMPPPPFHTRSARLLVRFVRMLNELIELAQHEPVGTLIKELLDRIDYRRYLLEGTDGEERWLNVQELANLASQYDAATLDLVVERDVEDDRERETLRRTALAAFLEDVALVSDVDELDQQQDAVTLITLHAAKGLEFPVVIITGLEEGLLPHLRSFDDPAQMEEERRLFYVGITRARERLYLTNAYARATWGSLNHNPVSRYMEDVPARLTTTRSRVEGHSRSSARRVRERMVELATRVEEPEPAAAAVTFQAGDVVRHAKFGEGIVVSATPRAGDVEIAVAFKGAVGLKKLLLSFAPLEKVVA